MAQVAVKETAPAERQAEGVSVSEEVHEFCLVSGLPCDYWVYCGIVYIDRHLSAVDVAKIVYAQLAKGSENNL